MRDWRVTDVVAPGNEIKCPKCGSNRTGVNVILSHCIDLEPGDNRGRDLGSTFVRYGTPRFTCECGHDFHGDDRDDMSAKR